MPTNTSSDIPVKPRVLIADDSRIVRATLIKHIEGMFEFREAPDGEQAWETLLLDRNIRVVITDLTMPKLDGYGLLRRIRASKIARIRNIPVVVVSGSDEREERERAKAAGATDLITKGIGTAQLLSRLDVLAKLANTQGEFERSLEALVHKGDNGPHLQLMSPEMLETQAATMLANSIQHGKNFVLLNACVGLKHDSASMSASTLPASVVHAIGQLLQCMVRQTDCVSQTGDAEFTLAAGNIHFDSARTFAQRVCGAIANTHLDKDDGISFIASCGMVSLSEYGADSRAITLPLSALRDIARRRAAFGLTHGISGVLGAEEEAAFQAGLQLPNSAWSSHAATPNLATLLQWVKEGKTDQVLLYIDKLSAELKPLVDLIRLQPKG